MPRKLEVGGLSLVLLLALYAALRLPAFTADPAPGLVSHYQDFAFSVFDEGWWSANAREAVLFGRMRGTGFDLFWVSPVFTLLMTATFSVLGVGLASARLLSLTMGAASVVLLWSARRDDPRCATRAALLWSSAFAVAQLGRLAVPETSGIALGLGGAVALLSGRAAGSFAAGLLAALAMLVKPHFGFLLPTFLASSLVLSLRRARPVVPGLAWVAAGMALPVLAWGAYLALHAAEAGDLMGFYLTDRWFAGVPPSLGGGLARIKPAAQVLIAGVVYRDHFFAYLPGIFVLAAIAAPRVALAIARPRSGGGVPDAAIVFGLWGLIGAGLLSTLPFQPLRYYLPLVPALAYLAAWSLTAGAPAEAAPAELAPTELAPDESAPAPGSLLARAGTALRWALGAFVLVQVLMAALAAWLPAALAARASGRVELLDPQEFHLAPFLVELARVRSFAPFGSLPREIAHVAALALCGALALAAGALLAAAAARPLVRAFGAAEAAVPRAAGILTVLIVGSQLLRWGLWFPERASTLPEMSRRLGLLVPADATVSPAGTYSLGSPLRFDSAAVRAGGMFDAEGGADYFVVLAGHPLIGILPPGEIERRYPGSARVAVFELTGEYTYHLYRAAGGDRAAAAP
jgi:hypothetical protein